MSAGAGPVAGLRLAAQQPGDLHRAAGRSRPPAAHPERRLRRRGHGVARRLAHRVHQHARRRHRALHHEDRRHRRPAGDQPRGLRRRRLLLARRQASRLARDVSRDRRRLRRLPAPAGPAPRPARPGWSSGSPTPTAATRARSPGSARPASRRISTPTAGGSCSRATIPTPRSRNFDLYLVGLDGSGLERVTTSGEFDAFPMFSPDGKQLVFASNRHAAAAWGDQHLHRGLGGVGGHRPRTTRNEDAPPAARRGLAPPPTLGFHCP